MVSQKEKVEVYRNLLAITLMILFIMFTISVIALHFANKFQKENQELKDKLEGLKETWRIEYTCNYDFMNQTIISDFHDYESYELALKNVKSYKSQGYDCEVKT